MKLPKFGIDTVVYSLGGTTISGPWQVSGISSGKGENGKPVHTYTVCGGVTGTDNIISKFTEDLLLEFTEVKNKLIDVLENRLVVLKTITEEKYKELTEANPSEDPLNMIVNDRNSTSLPKPTAGE